MTLSFLSHLKSLGLSDARIAKYASHLPTVLRALGNIDLRKATKADVERAVAWINSQNYAEWTKHSLKLTLKKLIQYIKLGSCDRETPYPPEVSWVRLGRVRDDETRVTPDNILTPEEVKKIISKAENPRDRAMLYVFFEAALRPSELLTMKVKSAEFRDGYCLITVKGKTGLKTIPLVVSSAPLLEWLKTHPEKDNPEAPLWLSLSNSAKEKHVSYDYLRMLLKRLAKKAEVKKQVWPYLVRHSALTRLAKLLKESELNLYAGWVQGSRMPRRYVHFSARDLEETVLQIHGLRREKKAESFLKLQECPRCGMKNEPDSVRCRFCGMILSREYTLKLVNEENEKFREIFERLNRLEQLLSSLLPSEAQAEASEEP